MFFIKLIVENNVQTIPLIINKYDTFFKRFKGLMLRIKPIENEGILLTPCNSIHMFFMFFAIDVVFLDGSNQIIHLREDVKPWTVIFPIKDAISVLELPVGTISKYLLRVGNKIKM